MYRYILKNKLLFILNLILILLVSSTELIKAYLFKYLIDSASLADINQFTNSIIYSICFLIVCFFIYMASDLLDIKLTKNSLINLKVDLFNSILKKDISTFNENNKSKYISTFTNDINILNTDFFSNIKSLIYYIAIFIMSFFGILNIHYYFIISILVLGYIPILLSKLFVKRISELKKSYSDILCDFTNKLNDMVSGFEIIKSFNIEHFSKKKFIDINNKVENADAKVKSVEKLSENINAIYGLFLFFFNMLLGIYLIINNQISVGDLIATVQLMNNIVNPLSNLINITNKIKSINLIYEDLNIESNTEIKELESIEKPDFNNAIKLQNVSFSYPDGDQIIKNLSHTFVKNKKYAIVGSSGSGKSTLLKLISKYLTSYEGNISIDDCNLKNVNNRNLNNIVSLIHQNVFVFNDTIKNNICLYQDYNSTELLNTLKKSGLEDLINNLELKENTIIEENGKNFSGGEKQRIAIARALIRNTPILLVDEATSALDNINSYNIEKTILSLDDITSILITHKINQELIHLYDEIIVLDKGNIVECGKYDDLMNLQGKFFELVNAQL